MDNKFFSGSFEYKYCINCKHYSYENGGTCVLFHIHDMSDKNLDRHHLCVFYEENGK